MENLVIAMGIGSVTVAIAYQIAKIVSEQKKIKRDIKRMDDFNIEFRGTGGSGISRQRKNYADQEHQANDDFRFSCSEPTTSELRDNIDRASRHNSGGLHNRPSLTQEKFNEYKEEGEQNVKSKENK